MALGSLTTRAKVEAEAALSVERARLEGERQALNTAHEQVAKEARDAAEKLAEVETEVNRRVANERLAIQQKERKSVRLELAPEIEAERARSKELEAKLTQAQRAELALRKEKGDLERRANEIDLEVARKVDDLRKGISEDAQKAASGAMTLKLAEKDKTIADMQSKLEEAQRKGAQGSQQLQGEVLELDLEQRLQTAFPWDEITPVRQGSRGGDLLQMVFGQPGVVSGTIYWEAKRAANWSPEWVVKAKQDARAVGAGAVVIVTTTLPKGEGTLCIMDGVVVCPVGLEVPVAHVIRIGLIEAATARKASEGRGTKEALIYSYLTGPQFKAWLTGIAEPFVQMQKDLESEVNATTARWKKRRKQIERVRDSVAGMFGDLQGIAGAEMPELPGFVEEAEGEVEE